MDWNSALDLLLGPAGLLVGLVYALVAFQKGWIHTDKEFKQERTEKLLYRGALFEYALPAVESLSQAKTEVASAIKELKGVN